MGSAAKVGLLILMALVIALARFLEGEVKPLRPAEPVKEVAQLEMPVSNHGRGATPGPEAAPAANVPAAPVAVPAPAPTPAPAPEPAKKTYTVVKGDTLGGISTKVYGKSGHWKKILEANAAALGSNAKNLKPGMELVIPPKP